MTATPPGAGTRTHRAAAAASPVQPTTPVGQQHVDRQVQPAGPDGPAIPVGQKHVSDKGEPTGLDGSATPVGQHRDQLDQLAGLDGLICPASSVEIGIGGDGSDPFDATLLLAGPDPTGREVAVWTRLTPPVITDLIGQLDDLLCAQQETLGVIDPGMPDITTAPENGDNGPDDLAAEDGSGRVKRFLDPMGLRHLRTRSPGNTVILAAAIAGLLLLAVIVQLVRS